MNIHEILDEIMKKGNNPTRIVSITTKTFPPLLKNGRLSKKPCPWTEGVAKIATRYGIIGCNYRSCVNRQREREGRLVNRQYQVTPFKVNKLWNGQGEHVPGSPYLVRHRDNQEKLYLAFMPFNRNDTPAIGEEMYYDVTTGKIITPELLNEYLTIPRKPINQGVKKPVFWRIIALENILQIKCGEIYYVDNPTPAATPS